MDSCKYTINLTGDVMLGRLIDQLLPTHVHEPTEAQHVRSFAVRNLQLQKYSHESPWGTLLPLLKEADLNLINLETSVTDSSKKWPDKTFNYRMHPDNLECLKIANIDYAGLANNHTLDFSLQGLEDTVKYVRAAGIAGAGAGLSRNEALQPAILHLPNSRKLTSGSNSPEGGETSFQIKVWAGSDHPSEWREIPTFHFVDYGDATREHLRALLSTPEQSPETTAPKPLKIFSVHWGPNYSWRPAREIRNLAHFLIDECGVDIVHGHSSHHIQGVEVHNKRLIIYGCGDLVDDYALVADFRNDLSALWRVHLRANHSLEQQRPHLIVDSLEVIPTKCTKFVVDPLGKDDPDWNWYSRTFSTLCSDVGTTVKEDAIPDSAVVVNPVGKAATDQIRGPCPGLNAAANHGYLPRSGVASLLNAIEGLGAVYVLGADLAGFLAACAIVIDGDVLSQTWSIGGPPPTFSGGLLGKPHGIIWSHNKYEGDTSICRCDAFVNDGDAHSLSTTRFRYAIESNLQARKYTMDDFSFSFTKNTLRSIQQNPLYFAPLFSTTIVAPAAHSFVVTLMSNRSAEKIDGVLTESIFKFFFAIMGVYPNYKWLPGHERIPDDWYRRPSAAPYGNRDVFADLAVNIGAHPQSFRFGGNSGGPNTYTGIDLANFTNGIVNGQNLLKGNNFQCFLYRNLQQAVPDSIIAAGVNPLNAATSLFTKYLNAANVGLQCPEISKFNNNLLRNYPGHTYSPTGPATNCSMHVCFLYIAFRP